MVDTYFSKDNIKSQFESYEFTKDVLVSKKEGNHLFELTVDNYNKEYEERIEKDLELVGVNVTREQKYNDDKYYKVIVSGLIG